MGSRIMHLTISENVCKELRLNNRRRFNYGNLLPDAHGEKVEEKERSHFKILESKLGDGRYINYECFLEKYYRKISDEAYLGYYSHLISDELWLQDVYAKYMLDEDNNIKKELITEYYRDYEKLNGILIEKYKLKLEIDRANFIDIEEVNQSLIADIFKGLDSDFDMLNKKYELKLFQENDIINYITKTIDIVTKKIRGLYFE